MLDVEMVCQVSDELVQALDRLLPQLSAGPFPDRAALEALVRAEAVDLVVARDALGHIVGTLTLVMYRTPLGAHAWIEDVVVDQAARRQGVGEALTRFAIRRARDRGVKAVSLTSRPAREAANRLYQRLGFTRWETNLYRLLLKD